MLPSLVAKKATTEWRWAPSGRARRSELQTDQRKMKTQLQEAAS